MRSVGQQHIVGFVSPLVRSNNDLTAIIWPQKVNFLNFALLIDNLWFLWYRGPHYHFFVNCVCNCPYLSWNISDNTKSTLNILVWLDYIKKSVFVVKTMDFNYVHYEFFFPYSTIFQQWICPLTFTMNFNYCIIIISFILH